MCKCDFKSKLMATVILGAAYAGMDFFFHHYCLAKMYASTAHLWRPMGEVASLMWMAYAGYLLFGCVFFCIFGFGFEGGKARWKQGLRYGILVGILVWGVGTLLMVPYTPYPNRLFVDWFVIGMVEYAVLGLLVGWLYKPKAA